MNSRDTIAFIKQAIIAVAAIVLFLFPLLFLTSTTDAFILPKQILLVASVSILAILWSVLTILERKILLRVSPFNISVGVFAIALLLSSFLSRNMYDSLASSIPVVAAVVLYFVLTNIISDKKTFMIVFSSLLLGGAVSTFISIAYYFKFYFLPIAAIQNQYFSSFGSPIQHVIYIAPLLLVSLFALMTEVRGKKVEANYNVLLYAGTAVVFLLGTGLIIFQIFSVAQKPILLPYSYGFQIATAAISQDANRLLFSFPFGSGYGTFLTDFTRFKLPTINQNPTLWSASFTYSSSYVLELLTTAGLLGLLSFLFIIFQVLRARTRETSPLFFGLLALFLLSFFLPFSIVTVTLLFVLMALYSSYLFLTQDKRAYDISISLVALREGLISFEETLESSRARKKDSIALPIIITAVVLVIGGYLTFLSVKLLMADTKMAASLSQSRKNNGQAIYDLQRQALINFPYRSDYYRIFSQINLALASSVANNVPQGAQPNPQVQQTVSQLLQQAISNARTAVALAPMTAVNWENLAQIYRNLIGVGQNADQFAIATQSQAIALDPNNPLLRIELGGVYYQLNQFEAAQNQFQIAVNLKPDFSNAYYNLGHALESKGDLNTALQAYQITLNLVKNNASDSKRLQGEIDALVKKIGNAKTGTNAAVPGNGENQPPLGLSAPSAPIPTTAVGKQVKVPPPPNGTALSPTPKASPTPQP